MSQYLAVTVISLKMQVVVCWKVWTQSEKETHRFLGARTETQAVFFRPPETKTLL